MNFLGNIIWFIFGGFISGLSWVVSGVLWCITIVGIPYGTQCFKFATLAFFPFGKNVEYGGGSLSFIANVIWVIFFGIPMALHNFIWGCIWCITTSIYFDTGTDTVLFLIRIYCKTCRYRAWNYRTYTNILSMFRSGILRASSYKVCRRAC